MNAQTEFLYQGSFLSLKRRGAWEYVERCNVSGCVAILAITENREIILVEQFRPPMNSSVIELPAGLAGDIQPDKQETLATAAKRELLEETGYEAQGMEWLMEGPSSAGLSSEIITFFHAHGLRKTSQGGGDGTENITVHSVPLDELTFWLESKRQGDCLIDYKICAALYLLEQVAL